MSCKPIIIPFHGNEIPAVEKDGRMYVVMKPIVTALELEWNKQLELIKRDTVLAEGMTTLGIPSAGGVQNTVCLQLEFLNGWLFKVPARRYRGERRKTIELYQRECYRALYDYWRNGVAVNLRREEQQETMAGLMKLVCDRLDENTKAVAEAARKIVFLKNFQPLGKPGDVSEFTGRPKDRYVRGYYTSNRRAKHFTRLMPAPDLPWDGCNA